MSYDFIWRKNMVIKNDYFLLFLPNKGLIIKGSWGKDILIDQYTCTSGILWPEKIRTILWKVLVFLLHAYLIPFTSFLPLFIALILWLRKLSAMFRLHLQPKTFLSFVWKLPLANSYGEAVFFSFTTYYFCRQKNNRFSKFYSSQLIVLTKNFANLEENILL